ncbi:MAG: alanyl-tRNA editing protein [Candidatus Sedimenticola endophacoides]
MTDELCKSDSYLQSCEAEVTGVDEGCIRLDRTVFYTTGGGQPGDTGTLVLADGREMAIADTRREGEGGEPLHIPVEGGVTGGSVGTERSRLDFNLQESPDKAVLGAALNRVIEENHPVSIGAISDAELEANPGLVRTMSVQPPKGGGQVRTVRIEGVDYQPCGGTHVRATGEIGRVRIGKVENKGRQNRRINLHLVDE